MTAVDRGPRTDRWRRVEHPDRAGLPGWLMVGLLVCCGAAVGGSAWSAASGQGGLGPVPALALGASASTLALLGLPSMSVRVVARILGGASALGLARFGFLAGTGTASLSVLVLWVFAIVGVVVFSEQVGEARYSDLSPGPSPGLPPAVTAPLRRSEVGPRPSRLSWVLSRTLAIALGLLVVVALALPPLADRLTRPSGDGDPARRPEQSDPVPLLSSNWLDMTRRPRLSDRVVFRVNSPRRTFWRGQTYDVWNGRYWVQSDTALTELGPDRAVNPLPDDVSATGSDTFTQRFELLSPAADMLFAAATPVAVDAPGQVLVRADGALLSAEALGTGATYSVTSRRVPASEEDLRRAGDRDVPDSVLARYAAPPATTDRVLAAATRVTRGVDGTYDRILALQRWMAPVRP